MKIRKTEGIEDVLGHKSEEDRCVDMIDSILAYADWDETTTPEEIREMERNSYTDYLAKYDEILGEKRVLKLIKNQMDMIDHIERGVYTDMDGLSYNSIVWKDRHRKESMAVKKLVKEDKSAPDKIDEYSYMYKGKEIYPFRDKYGYGGNLAVCALCKEDYGIDFWGDITVNLPMYDVEETEAFVNTDYGMDMAKFLARNKLAKSTGSYGYSGYSRYLLYDFNVDKIPTYDELAKYLDFNQ